MGKFYELNAIVKWSIALAMLILAVFIMTLAISNVGFPLVILTFFIAVSPTQFLMTPFLTLIKSYTYLSPMLLVFGASDKKYDLHNGTTFDYLMHLRGTKSGNPLRNKILKYYLEGLLVIIKKIEDKELPETVLVRGSSYFFSENTAKRLGFKIKAAGIFEKINLVFNYIDLFWTYSVSKGKISFPNLKNINTAEIYGSDLILNKAKFQTLLAFLNR